MELAVRGLYKDFGEKKVLKDVSFTVRTGSALGLLGRNGAGKTTSIRILMGLFPADRGEVLLNGKPLHAQHAAIGYLPEERGLYPKHPILDQMIFLGRLRGMPAAKAKAAAKEWLERVQLEKEQHKNLETLSKGNQQKVQLAVTLLHDPQILILDEPFSGLDPVNAQLLKDIVTEQVKAGKLVLFSSHQMSYVEEFCDDITLLHHGNIVLGGNLRQIQRSYPHDTLLVRLDTPTAQESEEKLSAFAKSLPAIKSVKTARGGAYLRLASEAERPSVLAALSQSGLPIEHYEIVTPSLQDIFIEKAGEQA